MDKYYIVLDDGKEYYKLAEETDYYDAVIQANACYLTYHITIRVIHNARIIFSIRK